MGAINDQLTGTVFNIQRYSIHDGPGIRTVVFLKGCPLSCRWCSNPESQSTKPEMSYQRSLCTHCGRCVLACSLGAVGPAYDGWINREVCTGCGKCETACLTGALKREGRSMTVAQVIAELVKDSIYYRRSGGGITLSGGEALLQAEFTRNLLMACQAMGWHTAVETTLITSEAVIRQVFPYVDLALVDFKSADEQLHKAQTGCSNQMVPANTALAASITKVVARIPLIPGFNADTYEIRRIMRWIKQIGGIDTVHLLPYHTYGEAKYGLLGRSYPMKGVPSLPEETVARLAMIVEDEGCRCIIGG